MKHILPLLAVCATTGLIAQPTLTAADLMPIFGTTITSHTLDYVAPGPATANFIFNVGNPTVTGTSSVQVVQPGTTLDGSSFPNATYALASPELIIDSLGHLDTAYYFYKYMWLDPTSLQNLGYASFGSGTVYSGVEFIRLPCTMGTTWTGTFTSSQLNPSDPMNSSGIRTGQCNGFGTLVLPYGTFTNVFRVQSEGTQIWIDPGVDTSTRFSITVRYYVAGVSEPLFESYTNTDTYAEQAPQTSQSSIMLDAVSVGIEETKGSESSALLYPNPANDGFTIVFNAPIAGSKTITLLDAIGRKVSDLQQTNAIANATTMSFDVSSVPRGMYIVRVQDAQGRSSNMPLVLR